MTYSFWTDFQTVFFASYSCWAKIHELYPTPYRPPNTRFLFWLTLFVLVSFHFQTTKAPEATKNFKYVHLRAYTSVLIKLEIRPLTLNLNIYGCTSEDFLSQDAYSHMRFPDICKPNIEVRGFSSKLTCVHGRVYGPQVYILENLRFFKQTLTTWGYI